MFAQAVKRSDFRGQLKIIKLAPGRYMFGTKKIMAKIINAKLVIRVGGGYMNVDEFIAQYGRMEVVKAIAYEGKDRGSPADDSDDPRDSLRPSYARKNASSLTRKDVKNAMKKADQQIRQENVKHQIADTLFAKFAGGTAAEAN